MLTRQKLAYVWVYLLPASLFGVGGVVFALRATNLSVTLRVLLVAADVIFVPWFLRVAWRRVSRLE